MAEIKPLIDLEFESLSRLISGYISPAKYEVRKVETGDHVTIGLEWVRLELPYVKRFDPLDMETFERYRALLQYNLSFGAYNAGCLVGVALAEPFFWNRSLWVHELHVAESHRGQGLGLRLVETLAEHGRAAGLRTLVCETQNTNAPAIQFYRKAGFTLEGVDLSYYTNEDWPDGEIAIFMKRRLA